MSSKLTRANSDVPACGMDILFVDNKASDSNTKYSGTWKTNIYGLFDKNITEIGDACQAPRDTMCHRIIGLFSKEKLKLGLVLIKTTTYCLVFEG